MNINDFISSIDNKIYNRIRQSKSDAECRMYLKEHLEAITVTHCCKAKADCKYGDFENYYSREGDFEYSKCNVCKKEFD